jgi:RNA 2',3'-cyclic 3'-phosphodiesterase
VSDDRRTVQHDRLERWRVFVAAPVNGDVRRLMQYVQNTLVPRQWPVRWVDPKLAHITLRFFGDINVEHVRAVERELGVIAAQYRPLSLRTSHIGAFPSPTRARVIWLGLNGDVPQLAALSRAIESIGGEPVPQSTKRPFKAHITLARLRDRAASPPDFGEAIGAVEVPVVDQAVDRIQLVRSVLDPKGPTYTAIAEWPLGARAMTDTTTLPELHEHG